MDKNSPHLIKDIKEQNQAQWIPTHINTKKTMLRHIIVKLLKIKDQKNNLKATKRTPYYIQWKK